MKGFCLWCLIVGIIFMMIGVATTCGGQTLDENDFSLGPGNPFAERAAAYQLRGITLIPKKLPVIDPADLYPQRILRASNGRYSGQGKYYSRQENISRPCRSFRATDPADTDFANQACYGYELFASPAEILRFYIDKSRNHYPLRPTVRP